MPLTYSCRPLSFLSAELHLKLTSKSLGGGGKGLLWFEWDPTVYVLEMESPEQQCGSESFKGESPGAGRWLSA